MKRTANQATLCAYLGALLLIVAYFPGLQERLEQTPLLHALWHISLFVGAGLLVYGLETLRAYARRYRKMTT
jgi:hypothetical protein